MGKRIELTEEFQQQARLVINQHKNLVMPVFSELQSAYSIKYGQEPKLTERFLDLQQLEAYKKLLKLMEIEDMEKCGYNLNVLWYAIRNALMDSSASQV